jgi:DNA-binding CsgD family transcriptional regulator
MRSTGWELFAVLPYLLTASAMASLGRVTEALDRLALVEPETTVAGVTFAGTYGRVAFVTDDPALLVRARVGLAPSEWGLVASILDRLGCIEAVLARDWLGATTRIDAARERALFPAFAVDLDALLAPCQLTLGDLSSATSTVVRLHESGVALGCPTASVAAAVNAASVGLLGASPAARSLTLDAVRSARAAGLAIELIDALELHAVALAVDGREEDARRFGGAAVAARSSHRYRFRWPHIHDLLSRYIGALGDRDEGLDLDTAAELALRGRGSRRRTGLGWAGLTPTEQKVVELVAQGCSNEDIAAALVMGTATVRTHLNHVYTKLGVSSRTALAAEATRRASALDSTASGDRPR